MTLQRVGQWAALLGTLWASGCNGGGTQPPGPPSDVSPSAGAGQSWYFNNSLPTPLSVTVLDLSGRAVPGVAVTWTVASGGGGVSPAQSTTDANGVASTSDSVGSSTIQRVDATVSGVPSPASFTEFATTPPTSGAVTVGNNFFNPDSVVVQVGGTVTWTWNPGGVTHTITFVSGPAPLPAETSQSTGTKDITFNTVGTYGYHCTIHPAQMSGRVTVVH